MSEADLLAEAQEVVAAAGIGDTLVAIGEFFPRGHTAGLMAGGLAGSAGGSFGGSLTEAIGLGIGSVVGMKAADAASGLPDRVFVAASADSVYLMAGEFHPHPVPTKLFGALARDQLTVNVHQRVNVRVLELIDESSGAKVELEGSRMPMYHIGDVLDVLQA